jgi:hypothetical protein
MKNCYDDSDDDSKGDVSDDQDEIDVHSKTGSNRPKLPIYKIDNSILPPLPLLTFKGLGLRSENVMTINGDEIKPIVSNLSPNKRSGDRLQHILHVSKLVKWFTTRSYKEAAIRQPRSSFRAGTEEPLIRDIPVYKNTTFDSDKSPPVGAFTRQSSESDLISNTDQFISEIRQSNLTFDSNFESGNLFKAVRVTGRENIDVSHRLQHSVAENFAPDEVDQEYDLTLRNDLNTEGNIQWYHFSVSTASSVAVHDDPPKKVVYPLKVRFNIVNMQKTDALYNYGMKPATFSSSNVKDDWRHKGQDICYYKQCPYSTEGDINNNQKACYVLSFTYTFLGPVVVFFAHAFPYTYTDMKKYLASLEENPRIAAIMSRKEICKTIAGIHIYIYVYIYMYM